MKQSYLCTITLLIVCLATSASADIDPKQSCGTLARAIGEGDPNIVADAMRSASRGAMDEAAAAGAEQFTTFAKQAGPFILAEFMAEREFGERYKREWYMLLFDGQSLFLMCEHIKPDNAWQLVNIKFNSDFEELPAP